MFEQYEPLQKFEGRIEEIEFTLLIELRSLNSTLESFNNECHSKESSSRVVI